MWGLWQGIQMWNNFGKKTKSSFNKDEDCPYYEECLSYMKIQRNASLVLLFVKDESRNGDEDENVVESN